MGFWDVSPQWLRIVCSPWRSSPRSWLASAWHLSNESSQGIYALQRFFPHPFHEICFVFDLLLVQMKLCIPSWKKLEKRTVLLDGPEATFGWNHSSWVKRQRMAILVPFGTDICISVQCIFRDYLDPLGGTVVFIDPPKKTLPQICRKKWSGVQSFTGVALPLLEVFFNQCWAGHIFSGYQDVHSTGGTCWKHSGRILNGLSWFISQKVQGWPLQKHGGRLSVKKKQLQLHFWALFRGWNVYCVLHCPVPVARTQQTQVSKRIVLGTHEWKMKDQWVHKNWNQTWFPSWPWLHRSFWNLINPGFEALILKHLDSIGVAGL